MTRDDAKYTASWVGITAFILENKLQEFERNNPNVDTRASRSRIDNLRRAEWIIHELLEEVDSLNKECNRLLHYINADSN